MFIGHYAPALAAATRHRAPGLGALFIAAQLVDLAFFVFALFGVEHYALSPRFTVMSSFDLYDVPWTHSLLGTLGWAAGFAVAWRVATRDWRGAWLGAAVVAAHWPLDLLVHAPDLTLAGGGRRYGFALWDHPYVAMPLELMLLFVATTVYHQRTRAVDWRGHAALGALAVALVGLQLAAWLEAPPPALADPAPAGTAIRALAAYVVVGVLAFWTGATRVAAPATDERQPVDRPA